MLRILRSIIVFAEEIALMDAAAGLVRRTALYIGLGIVMLMLILVIAACGITSLWLWADIRFGPVQAPLIVAGALFALVLVMLIIVALTQRRARKSRAIRTSEALQGFAQAPGRLASTALQGFLAGFATRPAPKRTTR